MIFGRPGAQRYKLFKAFGFPIFAESSILFLLVLYLFMGASGGAAGTIAALIFCLVAFFSIIVHELGHAVMIRRLGHGESTIVLHGLGGVCQWRGGASRRDRIFISLAGPGAGLILGGLVWLAVTLIGWPSEFLSTSLLRALLFVNIGWSVFNLLPIWPLDGGHVVRDFLSGRRSRSQTLAVSLQVSMAAAGVGVVLALMYQFTFVAILLGFILYSNYNEYKQLRGPAPPKSFYGY